MILLVGIAVAIFVALLRGGDLENLGHVRIRWAWIAFVALAIQVGLVRLLPNWVGAARLFFPLTHAAILAVAWVNRDLQGMRLLAVGVALNLIVILANGGYMPVTPEALVGAGVVESVESVTFGRPVKASKSVVLPGDKITLGWLSDIITLRPVRKVISVGDVFVTAGVFIFVQGMMLQREE
ncbi:MAG: hypothetical protein MAG451_00007 [Anaerolineales bacterium]|nr:hypothetical protein [Anaerolineales bacterium]